MITDLQKRARRLRAQITEAFDTVPYPGDDSLLTNKGGQLDDDYEDVIRDLIGKHWRDLIPRRKPPRGLSNPLLKNLHFCSAAAWQFFLPAYLITDLRRGSTDLFLFELRNSTAIRFDCLSAEQCAVIASFLAYGVLLLEEKQTRKPQYFNYYQRERQQLEPIAAYWKNRAEQL